MLEFNVTGIQPEGKKNFQTFKSLRPQGMADLIPEPENKYDKFCIRVEFDGVTIGYVPAEKRNGEYVGSEIQREILENKIKTARVKSYAYMDENEVFNEDHRGRLAAVTLAIAEIENDTGKAIGAKYQRVTSFLKYFDPYGGGDGLIKWAFEEAVEFAANDPDETSTTTGAEYLFNAYKQRLNDTAEAGTKLHADIEAFMNKEKQLEDLPSNVQRFFDKYDVDPCYMEERFFDNTLGVTGQPDLVAYVDGVLTVVDWKSSKKPNLKHKLQVSIYAMNASFDGEKPEQAMVVAFGAENKQGFSVSSVKRSQVENNYVAMMHVKKAMTLCGVWVNKYWEGENGDK